MVALLVANLKTKRFTLKSGIFFCEYLVMKMFLLKDLAFSFNDSRAVVSKWQ